jgi:PAS domain S-box-containing protein
MAQSRSSNDVWDSIALDLISIQIEGKIVYINTAGAEMLGATSPEQLIGRSMLDFVHPDYYEFAIERERHTNAKRLVLCPETEKWIRLDGKVIDVEVAAVHIIYEGHSAVQLMACKDNGFKPYWTVRHGRFPVRGRHK